MPKRLRKYFRQATLYRQLGNTYSEAMERLPRVHREIEDLFAFERMLSPQERARALAVANLGEPIVRASEIHGMYNEDGLPIFDEFYDLALELDGSVPISVLSKLAEGKFRTTGVTLERAFLIYRSDKEKADPDPTRNRDLRTRLDRLQKDIIAACGEPLFKETSLRDLRRRDANALRDHLHGKMSPNSVVRTLNVLKAAVNHAIREEDIDAKNPFAQLQVTGAGSSKNDRLPLTEDDVDTARPFFQSSADAALLFQLLADTGARLGEMIGLAAQDIDLTKRLMHIRPNAHGRLKTKFSERTLPLSQRCLELLNERLSNKAMGDAVFPRYVDNRGSDRASGMMMKRLRKTVTDPKKTVHSLRHRMKDALRNTGCPEDLSRAILGHASNTIAANYGSGYASEKMRAAMERVWTGHE